MHADQPARRKPRAQGTPHLADVGKKSIKSVICDLSYMPCAIPSSSPPPHVPLWSWKNMVTLDIHNKCATYDENVSELSLIMTRHQVRTTSRRGYPLECWWDKEVKATLDAQQGSVHQACHILRMQCLQGCSWYLMYTSFGRESVPNICQHCCMFAAFNSSTAGTVPERNRASGVELPRPHGEGSHPRRYELVLIRGPLS